MCCDNSWRCAATEATHYWGGSRPQAAGRPHLYPRRKRRPQLAKDDVGPGRGTAGEMGQRRDQLAEPRHRATALNSCSTRAAVVPQGKEQKESTGQVRGDKAKGRESHAYVESTESECGEGAAARGSGAGIPDAICSPHACTHAAAAAAARPSSPPCYRHR